MEQSSIRVKEHYGLITNDTNTNQYTFLISPPKGRNSPQKSDLVLVDHPTNPDIVVICEIVEISSYEEVAGSTIRDRIGKMLATAKIIGATNPNQPNQPLQPLLTPPNPGSRIYMPYDTFIETLYMRSAAGKPYTRPIELGKTAITALTPQNTSRPVTVTLDEAHLTGTHTLIAAADGAGKTALAKAIVEQLKSRACVVVFDPNSEYSLEGAQVLAVDSDREAIIKKVAANQTLCLTANLLSQSERVREYSGVLVELAFHRRAKSVPPLVVVVEEADALQSQAIQEVTAQKIGVAAVLVTNSPSALGAKVLSQTQTQIVGKTVSPQDAAALKGLVGSDIASLGVGEWLACGTGVFHPLKLRSIPPKQA